MKFKIIPKFFDPINTNRFCCDVTVENRCAFQQRKNCSDIRLLEQVTYFQTVFIVEIIIIKAGLILITTIYSPLWGQQEKFNAKKTCLELYETTRPDAIALLGFNRFFNMNTNGYTSKRLSSQQYSLFFLFFFNCCCFGCYITTK